MGTGQREGDVYRKLVVEFITMSEKLKELAQGHVCSLYHDFRNPYIVENS